MNKKMKNLKMLQRMITQEKDFLIQRIQQYRLNLENVIYNLHALHEFTMRQEIEYSEFRESGCGDTRQAFLKQQKEKEDGLLKKKDGIEKELTKLEKEFINLVFKDKVYKTIHEKEQQLEKEKISKKEQDFLDEITSRVSTL